MSSLQDPQSVAQMGGVELEKAGDCVVWTVVHYVFGFHMLPDGLSEMLCAFLDASVGVRPR